MSGVTTTGATVIVGLVFAPPGILLWRAILQWLGGIGIIVMAVAVLPMLQVGGMQLFRIEAFDADKVLPRAAQIAGGIGIVYVFLTSVRSEEHTSELQSLMRTSYAVFCLKKKTTTRNRKIEQIRIQ